MPTSLSAPSDLASVSTEWSPYADPNPFLVHIGPLLRRRAEGQVQFAFRVEQAHTNMMGVVHGGMVTAFADHALGYRAWESIDWKPVVTIQLDVAFIGGARLGDLVHCHGELVRRTRSLCFMRGTVFVGDACIATASGVWKILG